jgi:hemerythrin-like domain-containing protein
MTIARRMPFPAASRFPPPPEVPMNKTLAQWHADHVNFARLLNLLEAQLDLFHAGRQPEYPLMLDIMYYMTHYPDALHHPKEDLVFALIRERAQNAAPQIDVLSAQHGLLKERGEELKRHFDDIVNGSIEPREGVEASAREYLNHFRRHMRIEETEVLPLASELLDDGDWSRIDAAIAHFEDPLFGSRTEERYAELRAQIARESGEERRARGEG